MTLADYAFPAQFFGPDNIRGQEVIIFGFQQPFIARQGDGLIYITLVWGCFDQPPAEHPGGRERAEPDYPIAVAGKQRHAESLAAQGIPVVVIGNPLDIAGPFPHHMAGGGRPFEELGVG